MRSVLPLLALALSAGLTVPALADIPSYTLTIKDHHFQPTQLQVPAGQKFKVIVVNNDPTPEEFESTDMHREKIVVGGSKITVYIGPLPPGTYTFFGDFHPQLARGHIVAK